MYFQELWLTPRAYIDLSGALCSCLSKSTAVRIISSSARSSDPTILRIPILRAVTTMLECLVESAQTRPKIPPCIAIDWTEYCPCVRRRHCGLIMFHVDEARSELLALPYSSRTFLRRIKDSYHCYNAGCHRKALSSIY